MEHYILIAALLIYIAIDKVVSYWRSKDIVEEMEFVKWQQRKDGERISAIERKVGTS